MQLIYTLKCITSEWLRINAFTWLMWKNCHWNYFGRLETSFHRSILHPNQMEFLIEKYFFCFSFHWSKATETFTHGRRKRRRSRKTIRTSSNEMQIKIKESFGSCKFKLNELNAFYACNCLHLNKASERRKKVQCAFISLQEKQIKEREKRAGEKWEKKKIKLSANSRLHRHKKIV